MRKIATIHTDFETKFGVPRQSGLVDELEAYIIFEPEFRDPNAVRGLEGFSHIWLIWEFSGIDRSKDWSPTVRPPRMGGNRHLGVFATRSPFRPNRIGLSSVRLSGIEITEQGPVIYVRGADLVDGTPIYDIKPYLPYTDSHPDAEAGYTQEVRYQRLAVIIPPELEKKVPAGKLQALKGILAENPRPHYHSDPDRIYGFGFAGVQVQFRVDKDNLFVTAIDDSG